MWWPQRRRDHRAAPTATPAPIASQTPTCRPFHLRPPSPPVEEEEDSVEDAAAVSSSSCFASSTTPATSATSGPPTTFPSLVIGTSAAMTGAVALESSSSFS
ncbi:unnamed protein product, partial [Ectocarpus fasciculatus]